MRIYLGISQDQSNVIKVIRVGGGGVMLLITCIIKELMALIMHLQY